MRLYRFCCVLALAALAGLAAADAQQPPYEQKPPDPYARPYPSPYPPPPVPFPDPAARELMIRGAEQIIRGLEQMLRSLPSYEPPVVTPEGDIIIKRHRGDTAKPPPDAGRTAPAPPGGTQL